MPTPATATPRAEKWLRSRLVPALSPLKVYRNFYGGTERHVRYVWNGETDIHSIQGVRFVSTTFLVYVEHPITSASGNVWSWDLQDDADKIHDALDFPPIVSVDGRSIDGCLQAGSHYFEEWESDPVYLAGIQLGAYYRVYTSVA